jgi:hypothetical protein
MEVPKPSNQNYHQAIRAQCYILVSLNRTWIRIRFHCEYFPVHLLFYCATANYRLFHSVGLFFDVLGTKILSIQFKQAASPRN